MSELSPVTIRPRGVRVVVAVAGVMLLVVSAVIWFALPPEVQEKFNLAQGVTFLIFGLVVAAVLYSLFRCRVDLDADGVTIVNGFASHRYTWPQIVGITLVPGNPWAVFDLSDGTTVSAVGIQGSDGALAKRQVKQVREFIRRYGTAHD